jgi:hypothetical protein
MTILLGILVLVLDVIALINILTSSISGVGKLLWILIVLLLPIVGMLLYFAHSTRFSGNALSPLR